MEYSAFLDHLVRAPGPLAGHRPLPQAHGLAEYLCGLAQGILRGLGQPVTETSLRSVAAVSGLVRACPPGAAICLATGNKAVLAAALLDMSMPRRLCALPQDGSARDHLPLVPDPINADLRALAAQLGVGLPKLTAPSAPVPKDQVWAVICPASRPVDPANFAKLRQMLHLPLVLTRETTG